MMKVFELKTDFAQNIDELPNIHKINSNDYIDLSHILNSEKYEYENSEIIVMGNFNQLDKYDFISNDMNIPVFSKKFIDEIISVNDIELKVIPLKVYDDSEQIKEPRNDFFTIDFRQQLDLLNLEQSEFKKLKSKPQKRGILKKVVLKKFNNSAPALFRVKESISKLFISESLLNSLILKGIRIEEVEIEKNNMNFELNQNVQKIIKLLNEIILEENFSLYLKLLDCYSDVAKIIENKNSLIVIQQKIKWNCRKLSEAPPKNKELGLELLKTMDKFHKIVNT